MRTCFSSCHDCNQLACAHTETNCGIVCPVCDWFICGNCLRSHSSACWESSDTGDLKVTKNPVFAGVEYTFEDLEPLKISGVAAFAAEGICKVIIENV
jgi:hypothetical protein